MVPDATPPPSFFLRALLQRALRTECLAVEGLRLQATAHQQLLGGHAEELFQEAEQRAYQRAEVLLA